MDRVLIMRPQPDAARTAALVEAAGFRPLIHPLMRISPREAALPAGDAFDALAFTSANGVRAWAAAGGPAKPSFVVGDASARDAKALGLPVAGVGGGDVGSLCGVIAKARPGRVLHVSGANAAGDLRAALAGCGVPCERIVLYEAVAKTALPESLGAAIRQRPGWVLLHSPRSARLFSRLVTDAGLAEALRSTRLAALSRNVADAADLPFAEVLVAARPRSSALVDILSGRDT